MPRGGFHFLVVGARCGSHPAYHQGRLHHGPRYARLGSRVERGGGEGAFALSGLFRTECGVGPNPPHERRVAALQRGRRLGERADLGLLRRPRCLRASQVGRTSTSSASGSMTPATGSVRRFREESCEERSYCCRWRRTCWPPTRSSCAARCRMSPRSRTICRLRDPRRLLTSPCSELATRMRINSRESRGTVSLPLRPEEPD